MSAIVGAVAATSGATTTTLSVPLASTTVGDFNVIHVSVNSTGTGVQPVIATPAGWTPIGDSWRTGSPSHELAAFYRFYQSGDPTSVSVTWAATGNAVAVPIAFATGTIDTTTPIVGGEASFIQSTGPTTDLTDVLSLAAPRIVVSVFGNRSNAVWSAATDGNIHDPILLQGTSSSAASIAVCSLGTSTSAGGARSLTSSASTSVQNVGIYALNPAAAAQGGSYIWDGTQWRASKAYIWDGATWRPS